MKASRAVEGKEKEKKSMATAEAGGKPSDLGGSIKVHNVQALASFDSKNLKAEILERYIRPEIKNDSFGDSINVDDAIPVIDLQRLLDPKFSQEESPKLKFACEDWGFFQLVNHGIPDDVIENVKADIQEFFRLPLEVKEAFAQESGSLEGYGQAFVVSEEQKLDWGDMLFLFTQPHSYRDMKFWPTHPPTFREALDKYSLEVRRVAHNLLGFMGKQIGLECERLINIFKEGQSMRINYYPPCPQAEKVLGLSPHSDAVGLTLLLQVNQVQGLQIRRNGKWNPVKALPGALVVNIGDILEIYTNGKYKSIEHRAVISSGKERLSVAAFHTPNFGVSVGPLPELVNGGVENYKSLSMEDYSKLVISRKLDGKSSLDCLKLNT